MNAMTCAIEHLGLGLLARLLGISHQAVRKFEKNGVPAERVLSIAEATGWKVTPHQLREDIYPYVTDALPLSVLIGQAVASAGDKRCEVLAQLAQPGLNTGSGKAVSQHPVQLIDQPRSNRRVSDCDGIQQEQEGNLQRRGRVAQQDGLRRKAGTALGHGKKARNVDAAILE